MRALRAAVLLAPVLAAGAPLSAQQRDEWLDNWILYPAYNSLERLSANGVLAWRRPPRVGPEPFTATLELQGRLSTSGTRSLAALYDAPGLYRNWRILAMGSATRATRAPYYGIGNTSINDSAEAANGDTLYNRYRLLRSTLHGAVQRKLGGNFRAYGALQWRHFAARPNEGTTRLGEDLAGGVVADSGSSDNLELRIGLLYDTRDEEETPQRGIFLEAVGSRGLRALGGDYAHGRAMLGARGFVPIGESTTLALRSQVELADRDIPFFMMYERVTSWRPDDGFGGLTTLRANLPGRWLAPNRALASVDIRYRKIDVPLPRNPVRIWLVAFADAGVVWLGADRPEWRNLQGGAGVGARFQYSKSGMFGLDLGYSRDARFEFATAFQFAY
jgi:outer membrane protein assembly factor BamA